MIVLLDRRGMLGIIGEQIDHGHGHSLGTCEDGQFVVLDNVVYAVSCATGCHHVWMDDRHDLRHIAHVGGTGAMPERSNVGSTDQGRGIGAIQIQHRGIVLQR